MISSNGLRCKSGTSASSAGYPTGNRSASFSLFGLPSRVLNAGPQFRGVLVKVTNPAY